MQHIANNKNKTKLAVTVNNRKRERKKRKKSTTTTMRRNWYQVNQIAVGPLLATPLYPEAATWKEKRKKEKMFIVMLLYLTTATYKEYFW